VIRINTALKILSSIILIKVRDWDNIRILVIKRVKNFISDTRKSMSNEKRNVANVPTEYVD
jgi:hypothetical protein